MKQCIKCKEFKIDNAFRKNKRMEDGLEYYCTVCSKMLHKKYDNKRNQLSTRKASLKRLTLIRDYNITIEQYRQILLKQNYSCAICKSTQNINGKSFAVDHNHKTGKIRGLLCNPCNFAIGLLKESTDNLLNAMEYLKGDSCVVG